MSEFDGLTWQDNEQDHLISEKHFKSTQLNAAKTGQRPDSAELLVRKTFELKYSSIQERRKRQTRNEFWLIDEETGNKVTIWPSQIIVTIRISAVRTDGHPCSEQCSTNRTSRKRRRWLRPRRRSNEFGAQTWANRFEAALFGRRCVRAETGCN